MKRNRLIALALGLVLLCSCTPKTPEPAPTLEPAPTAEPTSTPSLAEDEKVRLAFLKDSTALGGAKYMEDKAGSSTLEFTVLDGIHEAVDALTGGEVDMAALPANMASVLYHRTDGGIQILALNTCGGLYILERGDRIQSMADLEGKTLHACGQGADPEFVLGYLLKENGVEADSVDVQWHDTADEVVALMESGQADVCMLSVPAAAEVLAKDGEIREALDLAREWDETGADSLLITGCVVARSEFSHGNPEAVEQFLAEYEGSISYMADPDDLSKAAELAEKQGIVSSAAVAEMAIPAASLCFITGDDMIDCIQEYYRTLYRVDPAAIGGSIPDGAFYYTPIQPFSTITPTGEFLGQGWMFQEGMWTGK